MLFRKPFLSLLVLVLLRLVIANAGAITLPSMAGARAQPGEQVRTHSLKPATRQAPAISAAAIALPRLSLPDGVLNGLASGLAAAVVKAILQPIDTIKTVQQAARGGMGPIAATRQVIAQRGVLGLWSGIGITVLGSSPSVAVYFGVYSSVKTHLEKVFPPRLRLLAVALSASCGNTVASVLRAPYEVLKQRIQAGEFPSALAALRHSLKHEGPLGLFSRGKLSSQILRDVPYAIVTLVSYEVLQEVARGWAQGRAGAGGTGGGGTGGGGGGLGLAKSSGPSSSSAGASTSVAAAAGGAAKAAPAVRRSKTADAVCGALAGGLGSLLTTPMDVVKTRLMTGQDAREGSYSTVVGAVVQMYRQEGLGCFFIGTIPRLAHKIPANALFFLCYEAFRKLLGVA